jgi:O-antigen ligase
LALVLLALVCGRLVVATEAFDADTGALALGAVGVLAAIALMFAGPVVTLAALVALSIVPLLPSLSVVAEVDVRPSDALYLPLLVWAMVRLMGSRITRPTSALRGTPMLLFLGATGLSLLYVVVVDPGAVEKSFVSWLRFIQTLSLIFLGALFLRTTRDVNLLLAAMAIAGSVAVGVALIGGIGPESEGLGTRGGGDVNPNILGLISGLLVLMAFLGGLGPRLVYRLPLALIGAVGLVQSQSVGSIVGTSVALTLGLVLLHAHRGGVPGLRAAWALAGMVIALGAAYGIGSAMRPENLPHSEGFEQSTTWHRTVVGAAGVELAVRNPVIGVGWRRSSEPDVIGDPDLTRDVRARFQGTREAFFPDVEPTSVHNVYVQIAAELGLVGLVLLVAVLFTLGKDVRRLLRRIPRGTRAWTQLWFLTWGVVLVFFWYNETPLFGGQPETVVLAALVGAIAGLGSHVAASSDRASASARTLPGTRAPGSLAGRFG